MAVEDISLVDSIESLGEYLESLNYKITRVGEEYGVPIDPGEDLGLPEGVCAPIRSLRLLADYDKAFQIYFGELDKLGRTQIRPLIESFFRRYPQAEYLFVLTKDFSEILFVSPQRITETTAEKPRIRLRILSVDRSNVYHTDSQVLGSMQLPEGTVDPGEIWKEHVEAFNVEKVTKRFFGDYMEVMDCLIEVIQKQKATKVVAKEFAQQLLNRLMLLYFLQRKGWLKTNGQPVKRYLRHLWFSYLEQSKRGQNFYRDWLSVLYFNALNGEGFKGIDGLPDDVLGSFEKMPYLNGGLYKRYEYDESNYNVPDSVFELIFGSSQEPGLLEKYNFTVREDTPLEVEVAVDPEMLGKVYESLVLEEEREGRRKAGIFYTPRTEVDFMCRQSVMEYLRHHTELDYDVLLSFLYENDHPLKKVNDETVEAIRKLLQDVKVVDPGCGSGAFLVGMMYVIEELNNRICDRLGSDKEEMFELRNRIVRRNLYGADIKSWAVRVAELRLWLALIVDAGEEVIKKAKGPVLPNLTFRLRIGDSLVQEVGGRPLAARALFKRPPKRVLQLFEGLSAMKEQYFSEVGDRALEHRIRQREVDIFRHVINLRLGELERKKRKLAAVQQKLTSTQTSIPKDKEELEGVEAEIQELDRIKVNIDKEREGRFFWEIDFAEVFGGGGFDIVIGNPPYVRHEKILSLVESAGIPAPKGEYKRKLFESSQAFWGREVKYRGKADLYVYFYYQGVNLLKDGGILCLISSNSWLDVEYGASLQSFLLRNSHILGIFDNLSLRSFEEADVNTIIVLARRCQAREKNAANIARFVSLRTPWDDANSSRLLKRIRNLKELQTWAIPIGKFELKLQSHDDIEFRIRLLRQQDLWLDGLGDEGRQEMMGTAFSGQYASNKWGAKFLRAPEIFFTILKRGNFTKLGNLGEIQTYLNTGGADKFYFVRLVKELGGGLSRIGNREYNETFDIESRFLQPIVKSSRELRKILVEDEDVKSHILLIDKEEDISNLMVNEYVKFGVRKGYSKRSGPSSRKPWWRLPEQARRCVEILFARDYSDKIMVFYNPKRFVANRFYRFETENHEELAKLLNSTLSILMLELYGRRNLGQGALDLEKPELRDLPVLDLERVSFGRMNELFRRETKSVFEECGIDISKSVREQEPRPMPDRAELDEVVFDELGLTAKERKEVYWSLCELVKLRFEKASSLS